MRGVGGNSQSSLILVNLEEKPFTTSTSITHTAGSDNIFVQIYMDALPGVLGVSQNQILFFKNESVEFLR